MVAGPVRMGISHSGVQVGDHDGMNDIVQPVAGWWLCEEVERGVCQNERWENNLEEELARFLQTLNSSSNTEEIEHSNTQRTVFINLG